MGSYFRGAFDFDALNDYAPSLPFFGTDDNDDDGEDDDDDTKIRKPKLKNSLHSKYRKPPNSVYSDAQEKNNNRWYDKFFFGSDDETITTTTTPNSAPLKTPTESGFFSWFGSSEETTEKPIIQPANTNQSRSFFTSN